MDIQLDRDGEVVVAVETWADVRTVIERESAHWAWLGDADTPHVGNTVSLHRSWNALREAVVAHQDRGEHLSAAEQVLQPLRYGPLLHHESRYGVLVLDIYRDAGAEAGIAAYGFLVNQAQVSDMRSPSGLLGVLLTALPDIRDAAVIEHRLRAERSNYRSSLKSSAAALDRMRNDASKKWDSLVERGKSLGIATLRTRNAEWAKAQYTASTAAHDAVASLRDTENTFREFMQLQGPVEYWQAKATEHGTSRTGARNRMISFFGILTVLLIGAFVGAGFLIANFHETGQREPVALYVLISGGLAVVSTLGFWMGRILTKLYLSEHHLKTDADERAVMAKTYLALTNSGVATEADKQIILAALFRAGSDGIVKDDGPPDIGLQAMLSKVLASR